MQKRQAGSSENEKYLTALQLPQRRETLDSLADDIEHDEVKTAIKLCKRHRAHGPDEVPNDWYRDHVGMLAPLLTKLFALWCEHGVTPESSRDARIHALKKNKAAALPLEHRPIALLNTDCKIFTRALAQRLQQKLSAVVHPL